MSNRTGLWKENKYYLKWIFPPLYALAMLYKALGDDFLKEMIE